MENLSEGNWRLAILGNGEQLLFEDGVDESCKVEGAVKFLFAIEAARIDRLEVIKRVWPMGPREEVIKRGEEELEKIVCEQ